MHWYNRLGTVHISSITRDGDLIASQLADNLLPKFHFGDYFLGLFLALRSEVGLPGKQNRSETGICIQGFHWMYSWKQYVWREERDCRIVQKEKLNCSEVATEAPANSLRGCWGVISGSEMAFQSCLRVGPGGFFCSLFDQDILGHGLPLGQGLAWGSSLQLKATPEKCLTLSYQQAIIMAAGRIRTSVLKAGMGEQIWGVPCHYIYIAVLKIE